MKKNAVIFILLLSNVGIGAWALHDKRETEELMLSMLYLDSVTEVKKNLYVLTSIRDGNNQEAITYLERFLEYNLSILRGCKNDLCSGGTPEHIQEGINLAKKYQEDHRERDSDRF